MLMWWKWHHLRRDGSLWASLSLCCLQSATGLQFTWKVGKLHRKHVWLCTTKTRGFVFPVTVETSHSKEEPADGGLIDRRTGIHSMERVRVFCGHSTFVLKSKNRTQKIRERRKRETTLWLILTAYTEIRVLDQTEVRKVFIYLFFVARLLAASDSMWLTHSNTSVKHEKEGNLLMFCSDLNTNLSP